MDEYNGENLKGRDCHGHGTHVASNAAGETFGTAKKANIYSIRVLGCSNTAPWNVILKGVDYAKKIIPARDRPAVVSMSIGGYYTQSVNDAVQNLYKSGIPVVVSAGNDASDACIKSPASAPDVECIRQRKNITLNWLYEIHCGLERNKDVGMGL